MELSKGYCVKLTLVAMVVAIICLVAIVLLGWSLRSFWEFDANRRLQNERLEELRLEIAQLENRVTDKRKDITSVKEKWNEYSNLTNEIASAVKMAEEQNNLVNKLKALKASVDAELASVSNALAMTNSILLSASENLALINKQIADGEKKKGLLVGLDTEIASKQQMSENLTNTIKGKRGELKDVGEELAIGRASLLQANTNLARLVEQVTGAENTLRFHEKNITDMKGQIDVLEGRMKALIKERDDIDRTIRIQSPKEKLLMDRLADLAGQYITATNKLAETRAQLRQEIEEAQATIDSDIQQKNKDADDRLDKAKKTLSAAEIKASNIITEAKSSAAEIERSMKADKDAAEKARLEKASFELAASRAKQKMAEDEGRSKEASDKLLETTKVIKELEKTITRYKEKVNAAKGELEKLTEEVEGLREVEKRLVESIATRQKALKKLADDNDK